MEKLRPKNPLQEKNVYQKSVKKGCSLSLQSQSPQKKSIRNITNGFFYIFTLKSVTETGN